MVLDPSRATASDWAWAALSGGKVESADAGVVAQCAASLAEWAISRGHWTTHLRAEVQSRAVQVLGHEVPLPDPLEERSDVAELLLPGCRVAFTGCHLVLGRFAEDAWLEKVCKKRSLEFKKNLSRTRYDVLVAADTASTSRKAQAARTWDKPIISLEAFEHWHKHGPHLQSAPQDIPSP